MTEQETAKIDQIASSLKGSIRTEYQRKVAALYAEIGYTAQDLREHTQAALDTFDALVAFIVSQKKLPSVNDKVYYETWQVLQRHFPNLEVRLGIGMQTAHSVEKPRVETKESISQRIAQATSLEDLLQVLQDAQEEGETILSSQGQDALEIATQEIASYLASNKRINLDVISSNEGLLKKVNVLWVNKIEDTFTQKISSLGSKRDVIVANEVGLLISYVEAAIQRVKTWNAEVSNKQRGEYVVISPFRGLDTSVVELLTHIKKEQDDSNRRMIANQLPEKFGIREAVLNIIENSYIS